MRFIVFSLIGLITFGSHTSGALVLKNWGLDNAEENSHINAAKAWQITEGKKSIVVAVVDTGVDPRHPDLKDNLWHKPGSWNEYGYDFVEKHTNPIDLNGHGTHIAGIIGATAQSGVGASGVARHVSIMVLRCMDPSDEKASLDNCVKAIDYAIANGANIINFSAGGTDFRGIERNIIERAANKGILFCK